MILIKSRQDGFRRCGVAHSALLVEWPDGYFTDEELATLRDEPMLMVTVVHEPETGNEPVSMVTVASNPETELESKKPAKVKPE